MTEGTSSNLRSKEYISADFPSVRKVDWRQVAQSRVQWRVLVNTVTKLRIPENAGISLLDDNLLAYHEGLCSMELVRDELSAESPQRLH